MYFYLKKSEGKDAEVSIIFVRITYNNKLLLRVTTGHKVKSKEWDSKIQRLRGRTLFASSINSNLAELESKIEKSLLLSQGLNESSEDAKNRLLEAVGNKSIKKKNTTLFLPFFYEWATKGTATKIHPRREDFYSYNVISECTPPTTKFNDIDYAYYTHLLDYLRNVKKLRTNSIATHIKNVKAVMNEALKRGLHNNMNFRRFTKITEEADTIYLNEQELQKIKNVKLSSSAMQKARDLFLLGCYTAMRYSDYSRICPDWIKDGKLYWVEQKTGNRDCIPLSDSAQEILARYDNFAPELSSGKLNMYIKVVARLAGITERVSQTYTEGGKKVSQVKEKCELVSSHTARRTGATLLIKAGAPVAWVMKITGHKSEDSFWRYIRLSKEENAELMKKYINKL